MFQTEIILYLQSFESAPLNVFFGTVSSLGYSGFYIPFLIIVMFCINFRKGFYLLHVLLWTGFVTAFLKEFFALPRPCDVDLNVKLINKDYQNPTMFVSMGASHFLGGLPDNVIAYYRSMQNYSHGFPSGHVSSTTALWGSIFLLFQRQWVKTLSIVLVALMPITRMYLGRHFLVDVLGGFLLGMVFVLIFYYSGYKSKSARETFVRKLPDFTLSLKSVSIWIYFLVPPLILCWIMPHGDARIPGTLMGLNVGFLLLTIRGLPLDAGSSFQKVSRALIAGVFYIVPDLLFKKIELDNFQSLEVIRAAISSFSMIYLATELCVKLNIYSRTETL